MPIWRRWENSNADVVISSASVSGLEAFLYGKKVVFYIPENFLAADPLLDIEDDKIYKWFEGEDIDVNFLDGSLPSGNNDMIKNDYFSRVDFKTWLEEVNR